MKCKIGYIKFDDKKDYNKVFKKTFLLLFLLIPFKNNYCLLNEIEIRSFYSNETVYLKETEGSKFKKGLNLFFYQRGYFNLKSNFKLDYEFREIYNSQIKKIDLNKLYFNYTTKFFNLSFGKMIKNLDGERKSLILSENYPPFLMVDLNLKLHKKFFLDIFHGWLNEERVDQSNPKLLYLGFSYSPFKVFKLDLYRYSLYGGKNRPGYNITDYFKVISGSDDNLSYSKYDTDSFAGYGLRFDLSEYFSIEKFRLFFQDIGTDMTAAWQKEDKGKIGFPFIKILAHSYRISVEIEKNNNIVNFRWTKIHQLAYLHHIYFYEGYSYKGFSIGYPYGRDSSGFEFEYEKVFKKDKLKINSGYVVQPYKNRNINFYVNSENKTKIIYNELSYYFKNKNIVFTPLFRYERIKNFDTNPLPHIIEPSKINRNIFVFGISVKYLLK